MAEAYPLHWPQAFRRPDDHGVAVYFTLNGEERCFPCDRWHRVEDNVWAIAKSIGALRGLDRWGAKTMVDAAFRGFKALPESASGAAWWTTLDVDPDTVSREEVDTAYRLRASQTHPDRPGGDLEAFLAVQDARRQAIDAIRGRVE